MLVVSWTQTNVSCSRFTVDTTPQRLNTLAAVAVIATRRCSNLSTFGNFSYKVNAPLRSATPHIKQKRWPIVGALQRPSPFAVDAATTHSAYSAYIDSIDAMSFIYGIQCFSPKTFMCNTRRTAHARTFCGGAVRNFIHVGMDGFSAFMRRRHYNRKNCWSIFLIVDDKMI